MGTTRSFFQSRIGSADILVEKFQSFSFFCCSLYIGDPGVFVKKVSVCLSAACRTEKWLETFLWVESKPKTH